MTLQTQEQFYEANKDAEGNLTDEQTAQMLHLSVEGDTAKAESSDQPAVASEAKTPEEAPKSEPEQKPAEEAKADPAKAEPAKDPEPVLLAKDGVHTIPFEKLTEAREEAKVQKQRADAAEAKVQALESAKTEAPAAEPKKEPEPSQAAPAVDLSVFGDFSEEAMAKGVQTLVAKGLAEGIAKATAEIEAKVQQAIAPVQEAAAKDATAEHFRTIYTAHPDADSLVESKELKDWIETQPKFLQGQFKTVLKEGTAPDVVELFTAFKEATKKPAAPDPAQATEDAAAKAAKVIAEAKAKGPMSLSDIPAGSAAHHDEAAALLEMSPDALMRRLGNLPAAKVEELMNRVL